MTTPPSLNAASGKTPYGSDDPLRETSMPTTAGLSPKPDPVAPLSDVERTCMVARAREQIEGWSRHVSPADVLALDARLTIAEQQRDQALATLGLFADAKRIADRIEEGAKWVGEAERLRVALALIAEGHQAPMILARQTLDRVALTRTAATPP